MATAELAGKHLVLGMTGGIACYKIAELTRLLTKAGATVQVVMTEAATQFITPVTMQALSGRPVYTSQWDGRVPNNMAHIDLSREADAIVIAPASTDFLAKLAHGMADDLLSTLCVARDCPLLVVPAMNRQMWQNPATQRNVAQLRADGIEVLGPDSGPQACGEIGDGRMLEAAATFEAIASFFSPKILSGRRVLLTAGPTFEPLDPVRGITNRSSGKMGFALARAAQQAGAEVHLIAGPVALETPWGVFREDVQTAQQMHDAVMRSVADATSLSAWPRWPTGASITPANRRSRRPPIAHCPPSRSSRIRTFWRRWPSCRIRLSPSALLRKAAISKCMAKKSACARTYRC